MSTAAMREGDDRQAGRDSSREGGSFAVDGDESILAVVANCFNVTSTARRKEKIGPN